MVRRGSRNRADILMIVLGCWSLLNEPLPKLSTLSSYQNSFRRKLFCFFVVQLMVIIQNSYQSQSASIVSCNISNLVYATSGIFLAQHIIPSFHPFCSSSLNYFALDSVETLSEFAKMLNRGRGSSFSIWTLSSWTRGGDEGTSLLFTWPSSLFGKELL